MGKRGIPALAAGLLLAGCLVPIVLLLRQHDDPPRYEGTLHVMLKSGYLPIDGTYAPGEKPYPIHERMAAFMELHPDVRIEVRDAEDAIREWRGTDGGGEWVPDIVELTPAEARYLADKRRIVSLDRYIGRDGSREDGYLRLIGYAAIDSKPHLLPVTADPVIVYYDRSAFSRWGVPDPTEAWDWEEFTRKANWLAGLGLKIGIPTDLDTLEPFIRGLGGVYLSEDGGTASGRLDSDATVEAFSRFAEAMPTAESIRDRIPEDLPPVFGPVRATEMIRVIRSPSGEIRDDQFAKYQFAPLPAAPSGERFNTSRMTGLAIAAESRRKALAWELMKFIAGESDGEALRFVASNTLETATMWYRLWRDQRFLETLKDVTAREIVHAPPAVFDRTFADPHDLPALTLEDLRAMADPLQAKAILGCIAREIDAVLASAEMVTD
jgi:multiple sugar transport system substrate-binding protein